jgi:hypothetical protein
VLERPDSATTGLDGAKGAKEISVSNDFRSRLKRVDLYPLDLHDLLSCITLPSRHGGEFSGQSGHEQIAQSEQLGVHNGR